MPKTFEWLWTCVPKFHLNGVFKENHLSVTLSVRKRKAADIGPRQIWSPVSTYSCLYYKPKAVWPVPLTTTSSKYWSTKRSSCTFIWKMFTILSSCWNNTLILNTTRIFLELLKNINKAPLIIQFTENRYLITWFFKCLWEQVHYLLNEGTVWLAAELFSLSCFPNCSQAHKTNILWGYVPKL